MVMASTEEQDRRIVLEFCHLLEKSKQLFNGLRDLPQYGKLSCACIKFHISVERFKIFIKYFRASTVAGIFWTNV